MKIEKNKMKYVVDTLLFLCVVGMVLIGIIIGILVPEGPSSQTGDKYFLSLHRHQWGKIHLYLSFTFTVLLIVHLVLSWKWIKTQAQKIFQKGWSSVLLATVLAALLILFLFWQMTPKHVLKYESYGKGQGEQGRLVQLEDQDQTSPIGITSDQSLSVEITGQTTLLSLEVMTGIPPQALLDKLELPSRISPEYTLGQLRNLYGFSMVDVREAVSELLEERPPAVKTGEKTASKEPSAELPVQAESHDDSNKITRGRLSEDRSGILIVGSMTFKEIEAETGIPAERIIQDLGLPKNINLNETLGRLRKRYGFVMQDVRDIVASYSEKEGDRP